MNARIDIVALPGDGIGPEVMEQGLSILDVVRRHTEVDLGVEMIPCGGRFYLEHGSRDWPEGAEERCAEADLIVLGAVGHPDPRTGAPVTMANGRMAGWSPVIGNRTRLDLFANVRPVRLSPGVLHAVSGARKLVWEPGRVDMVFVRENTEGLYAGIGGRLPPDDDAHMAVDTRIITRAASQRVTRFAFELSQERASGAPGDGRKRVTCIVKDNVLEGCRLFGEVFREIGEEYPDVEKELALVDTFSQQLICRPEHYDVCVTTNLFGDILTDLAAVLQGGMGLAAGCSVGAGHAMVEPIHGSAPELAGTNTANPMAMILALSQGLRWLSKQRRILGLLTASEFIEAAVASVLREGSFLTRDLVGEDRAVSTRLAGEAVARELEARFETI